MMRIVIAGSRGFEDYALLEQTLEHILDKQIEPVELVSGHAKGADLLAERFAKENDLPIHIIKPDWKTYGRAAGPIRNRQMLDYAMEEMSLVVAFWDGKSKGTKNTIDTAKSLGIPVEIILFSSDERG